jgi:NADPH:quinone reductase-like Zn-dependent oxidoreductase
MHILIIGGSGGVGHIAIQVAKLKGAKVTAICSSHNEGFVKELGADFVISYDKIPSPDDRDKIPILDGLEDAIKNFGPFNMVFDTVRSNDSRDAQHCYENIIRKSPHPLLASSHSKYVCLGE